MVIGKIADDIIYELSKFFFKFMYDIGMFFVYATIIWVGVLLGFIPEMLAGLFMIAIFFVKVGAYDFIYNNYRRRTK